MEVKRSELGKRIRDILRSEKVDYRLEIVEKLNQRILGRNQLVQLRGTMALSLVDP